MRRLILYISLIFVSTSKVDGGQKIPPPKTLKTTLDQIAPLSLQGKWEEIRDLVSANEVNELYRLIEQRANYELSDWDAILASKRLTSSLYQPYDDYLRHIAAYEKKEFKLLSELPWNDNIPSDLRREVEWIKTKAWIELKESEKARIALKRFIKEYRAGYTNTEAHLELAHLEWEAGNQKEALRLYESLYTDHPVRDRKNVAPKKLREFGKFNEIETSLHLKRVEKLKRAALFEKAVAELREIEAAAPPEEKAQIELMVAGLHFSKKDYSRSEQVSREALKKIKEGDELWEDWFGLLAFSLTRQGQFEEASNLYDQLLEKEISDHDRQVIMLRLGLMALDDENFAESARRFETLRTSFPNGSYQESSHWFEAWSRIETQRRAERDNKPMDLDDLKKAQELLKKLPQLPEGVRLEPQALYWRLRLTEWMKEDGAQELRTKLLTNWEASFYAIYLKDEGMKFLNYSPSNLEIEKIQNQREPFRVADAAFRQNSWLRLENFARVHLYNWAQVELDDFRNRNRKKSAGFKKAVAFRLQELEDWSDLVRFSTSNFDSPLKNLEVGDEIAYFYYPQAYFDEVLQAAKDNQVSPFLIWGVMREESRFQADVISWAGAVGLLQLMPSLGARIARDRKEPKVGRMELTDAQLNIQYGAYHLAELFKQVRRIGLDEEYTFPLAVAAYNAGIGPVRRWIEEQKPKNLDEFIENIPYTETRNYVKRVIQSANVYYQLYGEPVAKMARSKEEKEL